MVRTLPAHTAHFVDGKCQDLGADGPSVIMLGQGKGRTLIGSTSAIISVDDSSDDDTEGEKRPAAEDGVKRRVDSLSLKF